jgi:hypothetical protein
MPNTPIRGLPYPAATDPVAQGAAAIQALATELDKRQQSIRVSVSNIAMPAGGALQLVNFTSATWLDWAGWNASPYPHAVTVLYPGRYRVSVDTQYNSQSGGVNPSQMSLRRYTAAQTLVQEWFAAAPLLNTGVTLTGVCACAANDNFQVVAQSGAGAAGGNLFCRMAVEYLGPLAATMLLDELLERRDEDEPEAKPGEPEPKA